MQTKRRLLNGQLKLHSIWNKLFISKTTVEIDPAVVNTSFYPLKFSPDTQYLSLHSSPYFFSTVLCIDCMIVYYGKTI